MFMLFAIGLGMWGYMFVILQNEGEIFSFVQKFLKRVINGGNPYNEDLISGWRFFLHKSLTCSKCASGQLAVIIFLFFTSLPIEFIFPFVGVAMFTAYLISSKIDNF